MDEVIEYVAKRSKELRNFQCHENAAKHYLVSLPILILGILMMAGGLKFLGALMFSIGIVGIFFHFIIGTSLYWYYEFTYPNKENESRLRLIVFLAVISYPEITRYLMNKLRESAKNSRERKNNA